MKQINVFMIAILFSQLRLSLFHVVNNAMLILPALAAVLNLVVLFNPRKRDKNSNLNVFSIITVVKNLITTTCFKSVSHFVKINLQHPKNVKMMMMMKMIIMTKIKIKKFVKYQLFMKSLNEFVNLLNKNKWIKLIFQSFQNQKIV